MEYLIYHLRPFGINARVTIDGSQHKGGDGALDDITLVAWRSAVRNMGADDAFQKMLNDSSSILYDDNSSSATNGTIRQLTD
jgi:hypothetical protein